MIVEQVAKTKFGIELNDSEETILNCVCERTGYDHNQVLSDIFANALNESAQEFLDDTAGDVVV